MNFVTHLFISGKEESSKLDRYITSINYELANNTTFIQLTQFIDGRAIEDIDLISQNGVDRLIIQPKDSFQKNSEFFISCILGRIKSGYDEFNLESSAINKPTIDLQFLSIRLLNGKSEFKKYDMIDKLHKEWWVKFKFTKI